MWRVLCPLVVGQSTANALLHDLCSLNCDVNEESTLDIQQ